MAVKPAWYFKPASKTPTFQMEYTPIFILIHFLTCPRARLLRKSWSWKGCPSARDSDPVTSAETWLQLCAMNQKPINSGQEHGWADTANILHPREWRHRGSTAEHYWTSELSFAELPNYMLQIPCLSSWIENVDPSGSVTRLLFKSIRPP